MVYKTFLTHTGVYYGGMRDSAAYGLLTEVNELAAAQGRFMRDQQRSALRFRRIWISPGCIPFGII